jgi:predicted RNA-binding Zn ribbon-like protein
MRVAISQARPDPVTPYRYIGGDVSVDFVNTADWTEGGLDRFCSYDRVLEWAAGAGVLAAEDAESLRAAAAADPVAANCSLLDAMELRGLLEQLFFDIATGATAEPEIAQLNERWLTGLVPPRVVIGSGRNGSLMLGWPHPDQELEYPLWVAAWSAAQLITSPDVSHIKRCGGVDCGWYYVDRSRNGLRRWCEMETCGTQMKSRRRAARTAAFRSRQESPNRSSPSR